MKVFFSGSIGQEFHNPELPILHHRLLAYPQLRGVKADRKLLLDYKSLKTERPHTMLMLDSGAFSVWNRGLSIEFREYLDFCLATRDLWDFIITLDRIPGSPGRKNVSEGEREECAAIGWERCEQMVKEGLPKEKIMPVFHQGEDLSWLERWVKAGYGLLGVSPANDRTSKERIIWLDHCLSNLCHTDGSARVRFHGLAVTSPRLMLQYPWWSVDSASWCILAGYGHMVMPSPVGVLDDFRVIDSGEKHSTHHIKHIAPGLRKWCLEKIHQYGLLRKPDIQEFDSRNDHHYRSAINVHFFQWLETELLKRKGHRPKAVSKSRPTLGLV